MEERDLTPAPAPVASARRVRLRPGRILAVAGLVILLLLVWQAIDQRREMARLRTESAMRVAETDRAAQEARALAHQAQESIEVLQGKAGALESQLQEAQGQYAALEAVYSEFSRSRDERALSETEQDIGIAVQQLQLAGNVQGALAALQSADTRLAQLDQARFLPLRKQLAGDIERLRALPLADVVRVALRLDQLAGRLQDLPLAFEHTPDTPHGAAAPEPGAAQSGPAGFGERARNLLFAFGRDLWGEFRQLVRIERMDRPEAALLAPNQALYLRENLRMRLLSARLALMQREGALFDEDVRQARAWLQRYFDVSARPVAAALAELDELSRARPASALPELEATQAALRAVQLGGKRKGG